MDFTTTHNTVLFKFKTEEEQKLLYNAVTKTLFRAATSPDYISNDAATVLVYTLPLKWNVPISVSRASSLLVFATCLSETRPDLNAESLPLSHAMEAEFKAAANDFIAVTNNFNNEKIIRAFSRSLENAQPEDFA